jgi:biopolymer transport protein ExbD
MAFSPNKPGPGLHRPLADINVTPLVDVMLVLLIVFMITAPMLTTGLKMDLPQARSAVTLKPKPPLVISVTKEGKFALDMDELPAEQLLPALKERMDGDPKRVIQIRGDRNGSYGPVYELIDTLVVNGFTHIALVSDPRARRAGASPQ